MTPPAGTVYVFAGPTIAASEISAQLEAMVLPPVSQGDVYRVARRGAWGIGIVDGYFERVPAVWHKEILWALARGVHVFGAASMGALRAAELAPFGMIGVGDVYAAYASGELDADDEVAVAHGNAEAGYRATSEALVNVRFTLRAARAAGVLDEDSRGRLLDVARRLFYPDRSWPAIVASVRARGAALEAFEAWLAAGGRVDQKHRDARAMIGAIALHRLTDPGPGRVSFTFQHTDAWEQVRREVNRSPIDTETGSETRSTDALLDELRLEGDAFFGERERMRTRILALELAAGDGVDEKLLRQAAEELRERHARHAPQPNAAPIARELGRIVEDEARVRRILLMVDGDLERHVRDHLLAEGRLHDLEERARAKHRTLAAHGLENPRLTDAGMTEDELIRWFFATCHGRSVPRPLDRHVTELGYAGREAFVRAILKERCYRQCSHPATAGDDEKEPTHE